MFAVISPEKIEIPPGLVFQIPGSWDDYETLSQQLRYRYLQKRSPIYLIPSRSIIVAIACKSENAIAPIVNLKLKNQSEESISGVSNLYMKSIVEVCSSFL
ncbi:MAG: hypothetical protein QNJ70_27340 [Xenococcaceae cyanobacterium MO_207.B15]|nr:hypothetical protein [Xenococcaceae cyanobacterium MO_207.B15]